MSKIKMLFLSESRCKENVEGRGCDTCRAGAWEYPTCAECECEVKGTTEEICNQETAECFCKPTVEGDRCDTCQLGYFDLQQINPEGCSQCFCSGKTSIIYVTVMTDLIGHKLSFHCIHHSVQE